MRWILYFFAGIGVVTTAAVGFVAASYWYWKLTSQYGNCPGCDRFRLLTLCPWCVTSYCKRSCIGFHNRFCWSRLRVGPPIGKRRPFDAMKYNR